MSEREPAHRPTTGTLHCDEYFRIAASNLSDLLPWAAQEKREAERGGRRDAERERHHDDVARPAADEFEPLPFVQVGEAPAFEIIEIVDAGREGRAVQMHVIARVVRA